MSPLRLAHVAVAAATGMGANSEAQAFLKGEAEALEARLPGPAAGGPCLLLRAHLGQLRLEAGDLDGAREILLAGQAAFPQIDLPDPTEAAELYWLAAQVHKHRRAFGEFFRAALLYLCYVPVDTLAPAARLSLAVDVSLAALLAPEVYSFGELLTHPIVEVLKGEGAGGGTLGYDWLFRLLRAVGGGTWPALKRCSTTTPLRLPSNPPWGKLAACLRRRPEPRPLCGMSLRCTPRVPKSGFSWPRSRQPRACPKSQSTVFWRRHSQASFCEVRLTRLLAPSRSLG